MAEPTVPRTLRGSPWAAQRAAGKATDAIYEFRLGLAQGDLVKAHTRLRDAARELDDAMKQVEHLAKLNGVDI